MTFYGKHRDSKSYGKDSYERKRKQATLPVCLTDDCNSKVRNEFTAHCSACIRKLNTKRFYQRRQKYHNNPRYNADGKTHRSPGQPERKKP